MLIQTQLFIRQAIIDWNRAQRPIPLNPDTYQEGQLAEAIMAALKNAAPDAEAASGREVPAAAPVAAPEERRWVTDAEASRVLSYLA